MKKIFIAAIAAALALTASATAFAKEISDASIDNFAKTEVYFNVDPTYTVTIPEKVKLSPQETQNEIKYIGTGTIKAAQGLRLLEGEVIEVTLSDCDYLLETAASIDYKLPYIVEVDGKNVQDDEKHLVATFTTEDNADAQESELTFSANDPKYAGNYSDTVTFTVAVK